MRTFDHVYNDQGKNLKGYVAFDDTIKFARPAVLVMHDWSGRNDFACAKAEKLASLGYVGFAVDIYGDAQLGNSKEEKMALIQPFMQDRKVLRQRLLAAYEAVIKLPEVDPDNVAVIGFCFGGLCALDLARSGAAIRAAVSFHGLLNPLPDSLHVSDISAKVLVLHGYDDPMVPPEIVMAFADEMTKAKVDWQIHMYGNTVHAFSNPEAHDVSFGTVYNKVAEQRSWLAMSNFLEASMSS